MSNPGFITPFAEQTFNDRVLSYAENPESEPCRKALAKEMADRDYAEASKALLAGPVIWSGDKRSLRWGDHPNRFICHFVMQRGSPSIPVIAREPPPTMPAQHQPEYQPGDVVLLRIGTTEMMVESDTPAGVTCVWQSADGVAQRQTYHRGLIKRKDPATGAGSDAKM